jgi:hypothetical protein
MSESFTTRTASLKTTIAEIRKLDAQKVSIKGEDIDSKYAGLNRKQCIHWL